MGDVFLELLNRSITASWLIAAVLCIRFLFRRIPRWVNCVLWGVVAVRLICPFSIESRFSLLPSSEPIKTETFVEGEVLDYVPSVDSNFTIVDNTINPILTETFAYSEAESVAPLQVVTYIAGIVWVCVLILLLVLAAGSVLRLHRLVREAVRYRDNVYLCDAVKSPFILGIIRPGIYLSSALKEEKMKYIIAHEMAHLRRKDHWWKPLGYLLLCVYWFNPLCWLAYFMLCKDIELACDEKVIKSMNFDDKKEYSRVLLSCAAQRRLVMACPLAFGEVGVRERVKAVLNYRNPSFWLIVISLMVTLGVVMFFMTSPVSDDEEKQGETGSETTQKAGQDQTSTEIKNPGEQSWEARQQEEAKQQEEVRQQEEAKQQARWQVTLEKYMDTTQLVSREHAGDVDYTFEDRHFACEDTVQNELENMVYSFYYFEAAGKFDKKMDLRGDGEAFRISLENEKENFEDGIYLSDMIIHELYTVPVEEMQGLYVMTMDFISTAVEEHALKEFVIVRADVSWKYNEKWLSQSPQVEDGDHTRYFLLANTEEREAFKIYDVYWESFYAGRTKEQVSSLAQVMERIATAIPLEEARPLTSTADLPAGDQLYFLDATADGIYALYGFHSDEYGYSGMLINYKTDGDDNWTYLENATNWIGYEFPAIARASDGGLFLTYCHAGGSGVHIDKFFYYQPNETGHLEGYELTTDNLLQQVRGLAYLELDEEQEVVNVYDKEGGNAEHFATISYTEAQNGQELQIKGLTVETAQIKFLAEPPLLIIGVGMEVEDSIMPLVIGELAFQIDVETKNDVVEWVLHDVSTYSAGGILELETGKGVASGNEAVELVRQQLIQAYENVYGTYEASDIEPNLYSDDSERLAYIIPRLEVKEETEDFYVIPVMWDFRVYKDTGKVMVYYNGIDPMEYEFDPNNQMCLSFAG